MSDARPCPSLGQRAAHLAVHAATAGCISQSLQTPLPPCAPRDVPACVQDCFDVARTSLPARSCSAFVQRAFGMAHTELVNFIRDPEFKCWNIHGVKRFATDVDALSALASRNEHGAAFADLDAMCALLSRQEWGLAEAPEQMMQAFPDMDALLVRPCLPLPPASLAMTRVMTDGYPKWKGGYQMGHTPSAPCNTSPILLRSRGARLCRVASRRRMCLL